jgi:hypothetical protein
MLVVWWKDVVNAPTPRWNGVLMEDRSINGTGRSYEQMQGYIIDGYNAKHGAGAADADSFQWTEGDEPAPLVAAE